MRVHVGGLEKNEGKRKNRTPAVRPSSIGSSRSIQRIEPRRRGSRRRAGVPSRRPPATPRERLRLEVGRQIDGDVVVAVGRVIQLVVDRHRPCRSAAGWFSMNSRGRTVNQSVDARRLQQTVEVGPAPRTRSPARSPTRRRCRCRRRSTRGRHRARATATCPLVWMRPITQPRSSGALGALLARIARRDADRPSRASQRRVDPPAGAARPVVRAAVGPEVMLIDSGQAFLLRDAQQVFDGVHDAARVAEGRTAAFALIVGCGMSIRTAAIIDPGHTPLLPAAMLATCVPWEPCTVATATRAAALANHPASSRRRWPRPCFVW